MVKSLEELKAQNAGVYIEAKGEGKQEEQKRVASLMKFIDVDKNAVIKAINDGVDVSDNEFQSAILMARTNQATIQAMASENPPGVDPQAETHEPEPKEGGEQSEEEKEKAQKAAEDEKCNKILAAMGISEK